MTREDAILHMTLRREELKHSVGDLDEDIKAFDMAIEALEQPRWIPVSERLPDIHNCFQDCLITNKHKSVYKAFFTDINGKQWWSVDDVIAWMPLPKPYKGESEDTE